MDFSYKFPAVRGKQAGKEYFIAMIPMRMISILFPSDEEYVPPEYRAQRKLNSARIPVIKKYIIENRDNYIFSALAASIDGIYEFISADIGADVGILEISLDAKFLINDGQHRKAAILDAIQEDHSLGDETISVVFFADEGLIKSQQMFTDLNKHAVKTSNSIAELYDSRDDLAVITRRIVSKIKFINEYTDKEKDILGKYSSKLFTLNTFYNANKRIQKKYPCDKDLEDFLTKYWNEVTENIIQWKELEDREIAKKDLRENYIITQAVVIQAFGNLGNYFFENREVDMKGCLKGLQKINWKRNDSQWHLKTIGSNGRMINNETAIFLTCNVIKKQIGIRLNEEESERERLFNEGK